MNPESEPLIDTSTFNVIVAPDIRIPDVSPDFIITNYRHPEGLALSLIPQEVEKLVITGLDKAINRFNLPIHPELLGLMPHTNQLKRLLQSGQNQLNLPQIDKIPPQALYQANQDMNRDLIIQRPGNTSLKPVIDGKYEPIIPIISTVSASSREMAAGIHTSIYALASYLNNQGITTNKALIYQSLIEEILPLITAETNFNHLRRLRLRSLPPSPLPLTDYPNLYLALSTKPGQESGGLGWINTYNQIGLNSRLSQIYPAENLPAFPPAPPKRRYHRNQQK